MEPSSMSQNADNSRTLKPHSKIERRLLFFHQGADLGIPKDPNHEMPPADIQNPPQTNLLISGPKPSSLSIRKSNPAEADADAERRKKKRKPPITRKQLEKKQIRSNFTAKRPTDSKIRKICVRLRRGMEGGPRKRKKKRAFLDFSQPATYYTQIFAFIKRRSLLPRRSFGMKPEGEQRRRTCQRGSGMRIYSENQGE